MNRRFLSGIYSMALVVSGFTSVGQSLPSALKINNNGSWSIGDAEFSIQIFDSSWRPIINKHWRERKNVTSPGSSNIQSKVQIGESTGTIKQHIHSVDAQTFQLDCTLNLTPPAKVNGAFGIITLPVDFTGLEIDGQKKDLNSISKDKAFSPSQVSLNLSGGQILTISGFPKFAVYDGRKYNKNNYILRFFFYNDSSITTENSLKLNFKLGNIETHSLDISHVTNRGFADERAGDGKGGWTDQGSDNDMSSFTVNQVEIQNLTFNIIKPSQNNGCSAIAIGGSNRHDLPNQVSIDVPADITAGGLALLHASAWSSVSDKQLGEIIATYANGTSQTIPVREGIECRNWWLKESGHNSLVAWQSENTSSAIGLYASTFPLEREKISKISFRVTNPNAMWMIVGINLSTYPIKLSHEKKRKFIIDSDKQWIPLQFKRETIKGSALDFSWTNDSPAGKHGYVTPTQDGTLVFSNAPDKKVRFFGVNLCFTACYLSHESAENLARQLVLCGYNAVRIHHHDTLMLNNKDKDSFTVSSEAMDKLDYLFFTLKQHGIYILTDLHTNRRFNKNDNIPECNFFNRSQMKTLAPVSQAARDNWKFFVNFWMNHKNPYTGICWKDDPALIGVNLINEDTLSVCWSNTPSTTRIYKERFEEWCDKHGKDKSVPNSSNPVFLEFLDHLQGECLHELLNYVKNELQLRCLVTSMNWGKGIHGTLLRDRFQLVDQHIYFDHPKFLDEPFKHPFHYSQKSAICEEAILPREIMPHRIFNKPFFISEFNFCHPNFFRAEGGPLIGAYASLQNWNALFRFAWSHSSAYIDKPAPINTFDAVNDPIAQLSDRIAIAMFIRGDVSTTEKKFAYHVTKDTYSPNAPVRYPKDFSLLGLITQIGSTVDGNTNIEDVVQLSPDKAISPATLKNKSIAKLWNDAINNGIAVSATGEIQLDSKNGVMIVKTPKCETITIPKGNASSKSVSIHNADCFQTLAVISLDDKEISESNNMLIIHLTMVTNSQITFANLEKNILHHNGKLPFLLLRGSAEVGLKTHSQFNITALSADGAPLGTIEGSMKNETFSFIVDTGKFSGGVMAYHLTR